MKNERAELLLVDDNPNDVAVAMRAFRQTVPAYPITVLRDGAELVEYLFGNEESPDGFLPPVPKVILLDLKMPKLDGRAALRALRSNPRTHSVPIVVVSWSGQASDIRDCYDLGANSFVVKRSEASRPGQYLVDAARYWLELNEAIR